MMPDAHETGYREEHSSTPGGAGPLRLTAPDGIVYRVYDATMKAGVLLVTNPPAPGAAYRVFRPVEGHRRFYRFTLGESRAPTEEDLERQLRVAEYLPTEARPRRAATICGESARECDAVELPSVWRWWMTSIDYREAFEDAGLQALSPHVE